MSGKKKRRISYKDNLKRRDLIRQMVKEGRTADEIIAEAEKRFECPLAHSTLYTIKSRMLKEGELEGQSPALSVQPVRRVTNRLKVKLQGVKNEMEKGGIERLTIEASGAIQVVYTPQEHIFDLENDQNG